MKPESMTVPQIVAELEKVDAERLANKAKGAALNAVLREKMHADHCAYLGVTVGQYAKAKTMAEETKTPLAEIVKNMSAKELSIQSARAK